MKKVKDLIGAYEADIEDVIELKRAAKEVSSEKVKSLIEAQIKVRRADLKDIKIEISKELFKIEEETFKDEEKAQELCADKPLEEEKSVIIEVPIKGPEIEKVEESKAEEEKPAEEPKRRSIYRIKERK